MKGHYFLLPLMIIFMSLNPQEGKTWGNIGHRIVGQIAEDFLTNNTKRKIRKIVSNENLADLSNWPDLIKSDPSFSYSYPWHYVSIPEGSTYQESPKNPEGDIVKAINDLKKILINEKLPAKERRNALAFLVHFIGDIHQPLHVGVAEDKGGNALALKWFGQNTNLHAIWDEKLIEQENLSYTEYSQFLERRFKDEKKSCHDLDINLWIKEAMDLRPLVYSYKALVETNGGKNWEYNYKYKTRDALNLQLFRSGFRLAEFLNKNL